MTKIGILGAGQLGRMLALAGYPLGHRFRFLDPASDAPAGWLAPHLAVDYADESTLETFANELDVITYEFENVPVEAARYLEKFVSVYPHRSRWKRPRTASLKNPFSASWAFLLPCSQQKSTILLVSRLC